MISINTEINASIEKVWDSWTNPVHVMNWNFASDDWCCPKAVNTLKIGDGFNYTMSSKDGSMSFDFYGTYTEVIPEKLLLITLGDSRKVEVHFVANGDKTEIIESFEPEKENSEELQKTGWQSILDNFKKYTESI